MEHKARIRTKILSLLLSLVMVLSLVPSLGLTAYADGHTHDFEYSASGDTITATCKNEGCNLTENKVTLTIVPNPVLYYNDGQPKEASLEGLEAFNTATGKNIGTDNIAYYKGDTNVTAQIKAGSGTSIKGATYTARLDVEGKRATVTFRLTAKPTPHTHVFTYNAEGNVITATCTQNASNMEACDLTNKQATLTLNAPEHTLYGDGKNANATFTGGIPGVNNPTINYRKSDTPLNSAPIDAGTYTAWCQLGSATARVEYTINQMTNPGFTTLPQAKQDLVYTGSAQELITAGATSSGNIRYGLGTADSDANANYTGAVPSAVNAGTYYVWCKIDGGKNYTSTAAQKLTVTIAKTNITPSVSIVGWTYGQTANTPTVGDADNPGNGEVTYTYKVKDANDSTYKSTVPTAAGNYTVKAVIAETANYNSGVATKDFTIAKATQTITANDVTVTFGDTDKSVSASVTDPATDGGAISYAVKSGDAVTVDASSGALTIVKAGTATVTVTAAETDNYAQATKDVTVTVNKATVTIKAKDQTIYVGGAVPTLVGADFYTVTGLVGEDTLTTAPTLNYQKDNNAASPVNTTAGTYDIVPSSAAAGDNYEITYQNGTLTISIRPSSGGGSSTTTVTVPVTSDTTTGSVPVKASVSGTTATVTKLTDEQITQVTTNKSGNKDADAETEPNAVVIDVSGVAKDVKTATIPTETVKAVEETGSNLKVTLTDGSVEFDATAQAIITDEAKGTTIQVNLDAVKVTTLTSAQQSAVESLEVEVVLDAYVTSNGQRISDFKGGSATLSVPYTLKDGQAAQGIVVWYVASDGTRTQVPATYDGKNVVFTVPHFSNYVIAYDAEKAAACPQDKTCPISAFTDAKATAWYHDGVHWALENGVMNGVGNGKFAPNDTTTRAQVVTMLWRLEGSPAYVGMSEFSDVDNEQWYGPAIRWASAEGIVNGYDDGRFGANDDVTREQLVTIMYRYAQMKKVDVSVGEDTNILSYDDAFDVSEWAIPAMQWAVGAEIVNGTSASTISPKNNASRAEIATIVMRYCEKNAK